MRFLVSTKHFSEKLNQIDLNKEPIFALTALPKETLLSGIQLHTHKGMIEVGVEFIGKDNESNIVLPQDEWVGLKGILNNVPEQPILVEINNSKIELTPQK